MKVPGSFDPTRKSHVEQVILAAQKKHGPGWGFSIYDPDRAVAHLERRGVVSTTAAITNGNTKVLSLGEGYGPADGEKAAARFESLPGNEGFVMTSYDPYGGKAELSKLSAGEKRCRSALAFALGVKAWEVEVRSVRGGGYEVGLPPGYSPAKHDVKLEEVATSVVGRPGWYLDIDVRKLQMKIVPAELPTFPAMISYDAAIAKRFAKDDNKLLFGKSLPPTGDQDGEWLAIDVAQTPHFTINGTTGAGKTSAINSIIRSAVIAGFELAIIDVPHKAVDYTWAKPFVRDYAWGCESLEDAVVALKVLYAEGERRAKVLKKYDVEKVSKLPKDVQAQMPPILIVVDELSGLLQLTDKLLGLPKDHPDRVAAQNENALHSMLLGELLKLASQMRFVSLHLCLSTQVANSTTGIPPKLRTLLGGKLLLGVNQNKNNRTQTFNDPDSVPEVPDHIKNDGIAGRGVGTLELEGQRSEIFKAVFEDVTGHKNAISSLISRGVGHPEPTDAQRQKYVSFLYEDENGEPMATLPDTQPRFSGGPLPNDPDAGAVDANGNRLRGAAAAAHSHKRNVTDAPF